ncbi:hypothetical protein GCM10007962_08510 [Yeosuana aromativorans]|uniref:Uncharacterized protein n=1 Tax=Yeosuana aromativorans TaxID=288019 RepID=A0A8J3BK33_9FLAO|nr:DUF6730 family protein [Yeosuana aromativorans]GGK16454.1 hypothetical protein GCM10007962_08510 [Yeosuana aromativorans]
MTKLEELTALLVNEINDFKNGVEKLDNINDRLKDTKIKMDVSVYKSIIEEHQKQMASHIKAIEGFESRFNNKINKAKIYPNWAIVFFVISLVVTILIATFLIFNFLL